jgi:hypothetical protein
MPDRKPEALPPETEQKENTMQLSPETRSILRQYKTLINERRRESDSAP